MRDGRTAAAGGRPSSGSRGPLEKQRTARRAAREAGCETDEEEPAEVRLDLVPLAPASPRERSCTLYTVICSSASTRHRLEPTRPSAASSLAPPRLPRLRLSPNPLRTQGDHGLPPTGAFSLVSSPPSTARPGSPAPRPTPLAVVSVPALEPGSARPGAPAELDAGHPQPPGLVLGRPAAATRRR